MPAFNPLDYPICLAEPRRIALSAWIEHIPFAMFLVDAARPETLVELGTHHGVSYCAFCQAIDRLEVGARCYAIDTWQGDPHAQYDEGAAVLAELRAHHDPLYGRFSRLVQSTFDDAVAGFADGTIDLLHIDGYHTYEAVRHDFETWQPKLSKRGIVLLHDTSELGRDFGVWRFWEELEGRYPSFSFVHGHGLGVALVGEEVPAAVRALAEGSDDERVVVREYFHRLGQHLQDEWANQVRSEELAAVREERQILAKRLEAIESRLSWKLVQRAWGVQERFVPPSSRRGRLWSTATRVARARLDMGPSPRPDRIGDAALEEAAPPGAYAEWARRSEMKRYDPTRVAGVIAEFDRTPIVSIVMPTYNTPREYLTAAIDSVLAQYYPHWELCVCDDASPDTHVREILKACAAKDARIKVTYAEINGGIGAASGQALSLATGEYVALLDHDDVLTPDALFEVVAALQEGDADIIYSDEDLLDEQGRRHGPFFKPAWSPDLLLSGLYTGHLSVFRKRLFDEAGGFGEELHGGQDWDVMLRCAERASTVVHLPKVLYSWRQTPASASSGARAKPWVYEAAKHALEANLARRGIQGAVKPQGTSGFCRVQRALVRPGKISIIIPTRDRLDMLKRCIASIERKSDYPYSAYEVIVIDNGSRRAATLDYLARAPHRVVRDDGPFNLPRLYNLGAREADGDYLLLLHDDTEVISSEWLSAMVEHAQRREVGAVGAKLLYPDGRLQHAGVVLGLRGVAHQSVEGVDGLTGAGSYNLDNVVRNCSAVSSACLMVRRELFAETGGLNEDLAVAFSDVDLCLRLQGAGYLVVFTPYALLRHYASDQRALDIKPWEAAHMVSHWGSRLANDPYSNPSFRPDSAHFLFDHTIDDSVQCVVAQPLSQELGRIGRGKPLGQEFYVGADGLNAIAVRFGPDGDRHSGAIRLRLRGSPTSEEDIRVVETEKSSLRGDQYHVFAFDPVEGSAGQTFYFDLELGDTRTGSELTVRKSHATDATVGPSYAHGRPGEGTLAFRAYCRRPQLRRSSNHWTIT